MLRAFLPRKATTRRPYPAARRLRLEALEGRWVPSGNTVFVQTNLVSDEPGVAQITDANLVNAWGISLSPTAGAFWVSDNHANVTTLYTGDVNGSQFKKAALTVNIPADGPTGQVFNSTTDFVVSFTDPTTHMTTSAPALFLFASESGDITGWNPGVPPPPPSTQAQPAAHVDTAIFKGLAIANNTIGAHTGNFLYATDFHNGKIDVFDKDFHLTTLDGAFRDPTLPRGYAPFGIQNIGGKLYVTYAKQDANAEDDMHGPGNGFIDVFDTDGHMLRKLVSRGPLNSPWGLALAPASFGQFAGKLLVGNFGDGRINVFDPNSGAFLGPLRDQTGDPIEIEGLWGLAFGNGVTAGDTGTLYFSAGPDDEAHGLFGSLKPTSSDILAVAQDKGGKAVVNVYDAATHRLKFAVPVANSPIAGGLRVAVGDVTGDNVPDVVVGTGPGVTDTVVVLDGVSGRSVFGGDRDVVRPFGNDRHGVFVAAGDVNGDGFDDIIVGPDAGQGPLVRVFSGRTGGNFASFFADDKTFKGGVRVAAGDTDGNGRAEVITALGPTGSSTVKVFRDTDLSLKSMFLGADIGFTGGLFVATGDVNGDGKADIIVSQEATGTNTVSVFSGADDGLLGTFTADATGFAGGVRVGTVKRNGRVEIVTAGGVGSLPRVNFFAFNGTTFDGEPADTFFAAMPGFKKGLFVAGGGHG